MNVSVRESWLSVIGSPSTRNAVKEDLLELKETALQNVFEGDMGTFRMSVTVASTVCDLLTWKSVMSEEVITMATNHTHNPNIRTLKDCPLQNKQTQIQEQSHSSPCPLERE